MMATAGLTEAPPQLLNIVAPPHHPKCTGLYALVPGETANGFPVWQKSTGDRWLYSSPKGLWTVVDDPKHYPTGWGFIASGRHKGAPPHLAGGWKATDGVHWKPVPEMVVESASGGLQGYTVPPLSEALGGDEKAVGLCHPDRELGERACSDIADRIREMQENIHKSAMAHRAEMERITKSGIARDMEVQFQRRLADIASAKREELQRAQQQIASDGLRSPALTGQGHPEGALVRSVPLSPPAQEIASTPSSTNPRSKERLPFSPPVPPPAAEHLRDFPSQRTLKVHPVPNSYEAKLQSELELIASEAQKKKQQQQQQQQQHLLQQQQQQHEVHQKSFPIDCTPPTQAAPTHARIESVRPPILPSPAEKRLEEHLEYPIGKCEEGQSIHRKLQQKESAIQTLQSEAMAARQAACVLSQQLMTANEKAQEAELVKQRQQERIGQLEKQLSDALARASAIPQQEFPRMYPSTAGGSTGPSSSEDFSYELDDELPRTPPSEPCKVAWPSEEAVLKSLALLVA